MDSLLARRLGSVPELVDFPFVDELIGQARRLAESYPDVASIAHVGSSRLGEPIEALRVTGDGPLEALVFGGVHPNEPIGGLTALHLAESLCTDPDLRHGLALQLDGRPVHRPGRHAAQRGLVQGAFSTESLWPPFLSAGGGGTSGVDVSLSIQEGLFRRRNA